MDQTQKNLLFMNDGNVNLKKYYEYQNVSHLLIQFCRVFISFLYFVYPLFKFISCHKTPSLSETVLFENHDIFLQNWPNWKRIDSSSIFLFAHFAQLWR